MSETLKQYNTYKTAKSFLTWLESKKTYKSTNTSKMYNSSLEAIRTALNENLVNIKHIQFLEMDILRLEVVQGTKDTEIVELKRQLKIKENIINKMTL